MHILALTACHNTLLLEFSFERAVGGLTRSSNQGIRFSPFSSISFLITGDLSVYRAENFVSFWILKLGRGLGASVGGFFRARHRASSCSRLSGIWEFPVGADQKVFILAAHPGERFSSQNHFESSPSQIFFWLNYLGKSSWLLLNILRCLNSPHII